MRHPHILVATAALALASALAGAPAAQAATVVTGMDPELQACVNQWFVHAPTAPVTDVQLQSLTNFGCGGGGGHYMKTLQGVQYMTNATDLNFDNNAITDLTPLAKLTKLKNVNLQMNSVGDVSPLGGLTNLETLNLSFNEVRDVGPLAGLTRLTGLYLSNNAIDSVAPLAGLAKLQWLFIDNNMITDISPLSGLFAAGDFASGHVNAVQQMAWLPDVLIGTSALPIVSVTSDPVASIIRTTGAPTFTADIAAKRITYSAPGDYTLDWRSASGGFTGTFTVTATTTTSGPATIPMYRIYSPKTGEHFYTSSIHEIRANVMSSAQFGTPESWTYEGIGWHAPTSGTPVYRMAAIPGTGSAGHLFTTDTNEVKEAKKSGQWLCESGVGMPDCVGWYSGGSMPVLRAFDPKPGPGQGQHNYTTDAYEQAVITTQQGWNDEGIGWYGVRPA